MRTALFTVLLLGVSAEAQAKNDYAIFTVSYVGAASRITVDDAASASLNHTPRLGFTVYGGDWFLELSLSPYTKTTGDRAARLTAAPLGGVEVGVHLPGERGNLAVALAVETLDVGLDGRGVDGGVSVHYAFAVGGFLRLDPSVGAGVSIVSSDAATYSGVYGGGEIDLIAKVARSFSVLIGGGIDLRTYGARDDTRTFDARTFRFEVGIALHDVFGIGHNDP